MRSQETWARRLLSCRCRIVPLLTPPFGNGTHGFDPERSASHTRSRRSLSAARITLRQPSTSRFRAASRPHGHEGVPSQGTGGAFTTTEESSSLDHRSSAGPLRAPLAGLSCEAPCEVPPGSDVPMIEDACGRLLLIHGFRNGHPSYRVATESLVFPAVTFFDAPTVLRRPVRTAFHDTVRALVARARGRAGVFFPCSVALCAPPLTPLSPFPEPRVAILRERRALGSAEIVSNPHIVKRAGLRDPRRLRRLAGVPLSRCLFRDVPWPLAGSHGSDGGDATSTTIRGRTHALS